MNHHHFSDVAIKILSSILEFNFRINHLRCTMDTTHLIFQEVISNLIKSNLT